MAEIPERDAALLLDMLFAARDALEFADGLTKERFLSSRLHQNAIIRLAGRHRRGRRPGLSGFSVAQLPADPLARDHRHAPSAHPRLRVGRPTTWSGTVVSVGASPLIERLTPLIPAEDDDCT
jgi:hypothetical protein